MEERLKKENLIYDGRIIKLYNDDIIDCYEKECQREYVKHPGGVCCLAVQNDYIYFIKQFRYPFHKEILELPAGKLEKDDKDIFLAMKRELKEELGFISNNLKYVGYMYPSVGYTDEIIHLFYSSDNIIDKPCFDEGEYLELVKINIKEAYNMLDNHMIHDAKTIILLEKLRKELLK